MHRNGYCGNLNTKYLSNVITSMMCISVFILCTSLLINTHTHKCMFVCYSYSLALHIDLCIVQIAQHTRGKRIKSRKFKGHRNTSYLSLNYRSLQLLHHPISQNGNTASLHLVCVDPTSVARLQIA